MQSYTSIRYFPCIKDGHPKIRLALLNPTRPSQQRNIATRRYTAVLPSIQTRDRATEICRSLLEPKRPLLHGALVPYCMIRTGSSTACALEETTKASVERSTSQSRSQERGPLVENGLACDNSGLSWRTPDANTASAVDESQIVIDALPREEDYNGFGK
ncbi:hypothetical protein BDV37DRAFT_249888, partial [Aspergillus pseudonomiae]